MKLSKANTHYIRSFYKTKSAEEIAEDLGITVKRVQNAIEKIKEEPETPPGTRPKTHFANAKGGVSMTKEQSQLDQEQPKKSGGERFINSRLKGCIGPVYPNEQK